MNITYKWVPGSMVHDDMLEECSKLYSAHYGVWSQNFPNAPGKQIRLSSARIKKWLENNNANLHIANNGDSLIAYAIAIKLKEKNYGVVSWVTQLVVHEEYRNIDVAKTLLFSIWGLSNHFAWGLITANPYAIRALEKATRRRCVPARIYKNRKKLFDIGKENLPYVQQDTSLDIGSEKSRINTEFFVDHAQLEKMIQSASSENVPWLLGNIEEGWEWFAFTFNDQDQLCLSKTEIEKMISASNAVTKQAYSRMILDSNHKWLSHTDDEVEFIISTCKLAEGGKVLDVGCGTGRHCIGLAKQGVIAKGIDYIPTFIESAERSKKSAGVSLASFENSDFRYTSAENEYDAVICLYDVIGSFVEEEENRSILKNVARSVKPGGMVLLSVMNYELTIHNAKYIFSFDKEPNKLLELASAEIMEKTGDVFNPNYYLIDYETHVVYRKEQFTSGKDLPTELIVRDRRFTKNEIVSWCEGCGLDVQWAKYVGTGKWTRSLEPTDGSAKEILVLCRKPINA